ncbi:carboxymuconolactone decarboxylase family protein [Paracoccus aminophilus]|nr:carboxymuconolactone decarboxylase family protein [Paracoccus aminophilus]
MSTRLNYYRASPAAMKAMMAIEEATKGLSIPLALRELVKMRVSQINGCAYCLNMHAPDARAAGVSQQKLDVLAAWRESPAFDARERAALAWADALTRLEASGAPDSDYAAVVEVFSETEVVDLTLVINVINAWNRFAVGFRSQHPVAQDHAA